MLRECNEIKEEIKNPETSVEYIKAMEMYCVSFKKNTANDKRCFYQIELFVARKNQLLIKIKNSTSLIRLQTIRLK